MKIKYIVGSSGDDPAVFLRDKEMFGVTNRGGDLFYVPSGDIRKFISYFHDNYDFMYSVWEEAPERKGSILEYEEKSYRKIYVAVEEVEGLRSISSLGKSQTRSLTTLISGVIGFFSEIEYGVDSSGTLFEKEYLKKAILNWKDITLSKRDEVEPSDEKSGVLERWPHGSEVPKPFLLLAGISGTGKSRFIRKQAEFYDTNKANFCLVAVRPDWHEPSDLLGYTSHLSGTARYIATDVLRFMVAAWKSLKNAGLELSGRNDISELHGTSQLLDGVVPFWLCLDEMNLAPVEQYFADYLSLIETREWRWEGEEFSYACDALLKGDELAALGRDEQQKLARDLGLDGIAADCADGPLWQHFITHGVAIPPNLIVAGTVNMDETTHGFSRKVIDRAMSFDFGEFFPNDFDDFYAGNVSHLPLTFPRHSSGSEALDETDAQASIAFLKVLNTQLKNTSFELAYRALNELLLAVHCHAPASRVELQAVWDDFLMQKVLPRIEGDADKLRVSSEKDDTVLDRLNSLLQEQLAEIWEDDKPRPDFYRMENGQSTTTECRSRRKLQWMQDQLATRGFTSFWP